MCHISRYTDVGSCPSSFVLKQLHLTKPNTCFLIFIPENGDITTFWNVVLIFLHSWRNAWETVLKNWVVSKDRLNQVQVSVQCYVTVIVVINNLVARTAENLYIIYIIQRKICWKNWGIISMSRRRMVYGLVILVVTSVTVVRTVQVPPVHPKRGWVTFGQVRITPLLFTPNTFTSCTEFTLY
jgi:hypothetical protein